ncbi:MAG: MurR/RpiR family transcriptional regulator [Lachnospiraceae bacterium]|nr:MurR/RpiR family transcriptional regulator [Lachnospiraceae bacterium]
MDKGKDLLTRINDGFGGFSKGQKLIAAFVIDHYDMAVFMTASKIAETVGVSESTVVRFAKEIGYDGFPEFTKALESLYKSKNDMVGKMRKKYGSSSQSEVLNSILRADMQKLEDTIVNMDVKAFEMSVDIILKARKVYVVGLRSCQPLAEFLNFYLNMIRADVIMLNTTSASEMFEQMIRIDSRDCIIGISFPRYSMRTLKAMEFAHDRNARVITITDSVHSPMNLYSTCNLLARSDMVSIVDSLVAPLSVINALVVALCLKRPKEVKANLENLEEAWENYQVYLNDEINFVDDEPILDYSLRKEESDDDDDDDEWQ